MRVQLRALERGGRGRRCTQRTQDWGWSFAGPGKILGRASLWSDPGSTRGLEPQENMD